LGVLITILLLAATTFLGAALFKTLGMLFHEFVRVDFKERLRSDFFSDTRNVEVDDLSELVPVVDPLPNCSFMHVNFSVIGLRTVSSPALVTSLAAVATRFFAFFLFFFFGFNNPDFNELAAFMTSGRPVWAKITPRIRLVFVTISGRAEAEDLRLLCIKSVRSFE
jgi:hypothetical protein